MVRRVAVACILAVVMGGLGIVSRPSRVEASCQNSTILILPAVNRVLFTLQVAWFIRPACSLIETGVLMGTSQDALEPVSEVFYRYEEMYLVNIPIRSGQYWVEAYTRDENGETTRSPVLPVDAFVPDPAPFAPSGSHGALTAYTGTDADFLQPAGNPHYASLRLASLVANSTFSGGGTLTGVGVFRDFSSPHESEVWAELGPGFPAEFISQGIAGWNAFFASHGYPRTGIYHFTCFSFRDVPTSQTSAGCAWPGSPYVVYEETVEDIVYNPTGLSSRFTTSTRSSLKYFVPTVPSGKRVGSAILTVVASVYGDYRAIRLNNKPPVVTQPLTPCLTLGNCTLIATWDFTNEVRALAEQGGGELQLQMNPIPQFHVVFPFPGFNYTFYINSASWALFPAVNYPWQPGSADNSLTITFAAACPPLALTATPQSVRPQLPPNSTFTDEVRNAATQSSIKADVCLPGSTSSGVEVNLEVRPPSPGSAEDGGHDHDGFRQQCTGTFTQPRAGTDLGGCKVDRNAPGGGTPPQATCMVRLDAQGKGSCTVTYFPFFVSGIETIAACINPCAADSPRAQMPIRVEVPGLQNLAMVNDRHFLLVGQTGRHPDNHWGTPDTPGRRGTITAIQGIALDYWTKSAATLGINDMSLRQGGLFDICGTWNPADTCSFAPRSPGGHQLHRTGTSVDINLRACQDPALQRVCGSNMSFGPTVPVDRDRIRNLCEDRGGILLGEEVIHCELPQ